LNVWTPAAVAVFRAQWQVFSRSPASTQCAAAHLRRDAKRDEIKLIDAWPDFFSIFRRLENSKYQAAIRQSLGDLLSSCCAIEFAARD
jgi:hypothetical protein